EAAMAHNSSAAHAFAYQAYETAVLAEYISNDTRMIASSIIPNTTTTTLPIGVTTVPQHPVITPSPSVSISAATVGFIIFSVVILLVAVLIVLLIVLYVLVSILKHLHAITGNMQRSRGQEGADEQIGRHKGTASRRTGKKV
ncbi:MAG: hypothetical protein QXP24_04060, partial [Candidatus Micrarchaeaceae archaeon]